MTGTSILVFLVCAVLPPVITMVFRLLFSFGWREFCLRWLITAAVVSVAMALARSWPCAAGNAFSAGVAAGLWWGPGRRRKRAPRAYGAKSKALVAALVRRVRDVRVPRPVLRPQPQPQGAL